MVISAKYFAFPTSYVRVMFLSGSFKLSISAQAIMRHTHEFAELETRGGLTFA
jgi:hypothetical protein